MEDQLIKDLNIHLIDLKKMQAANTNSLATLQEYTDYHLKQSSEYDGVIYYSIKYPDEEDYGYIGNDTNETVKNVQAAHFLSKQLDYINKDVKLLESFLNKYRPVDSRYIYRKLRKSYRNSKLLGKMSNEQLAKEWKDQAEAYKATFEPYRPEELIHTTNDGTMGRSKSEALIYNYLLEHGYTFVYELPFKKDGKIFYPDFTILSEVDYKTIILIEHQGALKIETYKEHAFEQEFKYWKRGLLPNRDVYFTYDDNRGGFDIRPIKAILHSRVRIIQ